MRAKDVHAFVERVIGDDLHAKRVLSLSRAVVGVIHAAALGIHAIGQGLACAMGLNPKHAIKQVDRLLSNDGLAMTVIQASWMASVLGPRKEIVAALDWTDFDKDNQATIALHLITRHGRATPLLWKTVSKADLKDQRNQHEDELLMRFRELLPKEVMATVLADRGFGDQALYASMDGAMLFFIIRFRGDIHVSSEQGETRTASEWVSPNGRARLLRCARVTHQKALVPAVVCVKAATMKDAWCLASNRDDLTASEIVRLYGRRFTIEENFRDTKDIRFGMGLSATRISVPERRDRLLLLCAAAQVLLTLLGAAAEETGLDRMLKANTVKRRTHSLFRQGSYWYSAIPAMPRERLVLLMKAFGRIVSEQPLFNQVFGLI